MSQTGTGTGTETVSVSIPPTPTITNSLSISISSSNTYTETLSITTSNSVTNTETLSITTSVTYTSSGSISITVSPSNSAAKSQSLGIFAQPSSFGSDKVKRISKIQCAYRNPNFFCKWLPGKIAYKRIRMLVECTSTSPIFLNQTSIIDYRATSNTSTHLYARGADASTQQRNLVSLDLPPQTLCKTLLTVRMYTNLVGKRTGKTFDNTTGVTYTESRYWFASKKPSNANANDDKFLTGPYFHP